MSLHFPSVTLCPYRPGFNPYQELFSLALTRAGIKVEHLPPRKWFPLSYACNHGRDVVHLDWHHDWYQGRNRVTQALKSVMYSSGVNACRKRPVVWTAHNLGSHDALGERQRSFDHQMTQKLISVCSGIMVMSKASEHLLRERFVLRPDQLVVQTHHGHYIDAYPNDVSRGESRRRLGIRDEEFVYLSLGSLRPYKGHEQLLDAFAAIATQKDRLLIAGNPTSGDYARQLTTVARRISETKHGTIEIVPEMIQPEDLQYYFNASDVAVLPFVDVLNSGSLLLAMSFGLPIVAPRIGSVPEVVIESCYVGYDGSVACQLADALREARGRYFRFGLNETSSDCKSRLIDQVREKYSWDRVGETLRLFYQAIVS